MIIRDQQIRRELVAILTQMNERICDLTIDPADTVADALEALKNLRARAHRDRSVLIPE